MFTKLVCKDIVTSLVVNFVVIILCKDMLYVGMCVKVDWTPELHRRFVEAVEQLGVDKAVPSRILELMGVHCLTRHNVASHLQVRTYYYLHSLK